MILPTKHVNVEQSLIGVASLLLTKLQSSDSVSSLWFRVSESPSVGSFFRFTLALDLLFMLNAVEFRSGKLSRSTRVVEQHAD
jgi:hypothetical protein